MKNTITFVFSYLAALAAAHAGPVSLATQPYIAAPPSAGTGIFYNASVGWQAAGSCHFMYSGQCGATNAGTDLAFTGAVVTVLGLAELGRKPAAKYQADGLGLIATGVGMAGIGYLLMKLGDNYEQNHPYKSYPHYHSPRHKLYTTKQGFFRFSAVGDSNGGCLSYSI